jgi:hypothetical protein
MASSMKEKEKEGQFPLSNLQFDVVLLLTEKSKALEAYEKYQADAKPCAELSALIEKMKQSDKEFVGQLKEYLGKCLTKE